MHKITVLGSTGTIGVNTLDVVARHPDKFQVVALTANTQVEKLLAQCRQFQPRYAVMLDSASADRLQSQVREAGIDTEVLSGMEALERVASMDEVDSVMAAIVGSAGLKPALAAAHSGKRILLANKETLVVSGGLFMEAVRRSGATLLPIDSEHNAVFQALPRDYQRGLAAVGVKRILLTASGGPFRTTPVNELRQVTPQQALAHPNWVMGPKISIDSATMMNKGLEIIEAHWLFDAAPERIEVVIHPQSVIHSMVEYVDGSILAQLGNPDMRTPIAYAMGYPERLDSGVSALDLFKIGRLDFEEPDFKRFPCLRLSYEALKRGGTAPAIMNGANEVAVSAFLAGQIPFLTIPKLIEDVLGLLTANEITCLEDVLEADALARAVAQRWIGTGYAQ
ncbi:MAG: 1-deoxy-D-xylulose-5-phosphate reductoisomerase [Burkholderiales bacterium]